MRTLALALVLCTSCACAIAQTTNTDCQVIGNQITCQSRSISAPPFAPIFVPPVRPATPLLTPEMTALIVERNRIAAEAMRRDVDRFTAELSSHDAWTDIKTGISSHVRMSGDRIYLTAIVPPGALWSATKECVPAESPGIWNCIRYLHVWRWRDWGARWQYCTLEMKGSLTSVFLDRITGEGEGFESAEKAIDWKKCKVKKVSRVPFTLIPRGPQQ